MLGATGDSGDARLATLRQAPPLRALGTPLSPVPLASPCCAAALPTALIVSISWPVQPFAR